MSELGTSKVAQSTPSIPKEINYGEVLKDPSNLFHGIGFDVFKLIGILNNGILSENAAKEKNLDLARNYDGYNLNDTVSVAESPSKLQAHGAFNVYIKSGISFIIKNIPVDGIGAFKPPHDDSHENYYEKDPFIVAFNKLNKTNISTLRLMKMNSYHSVNSRNSGFEDEVYIKHKVPIENISGIMIPEESLDRWISELPLELSTIGAGFIQNRCQKLFTDLEQETGYKADQTQFKELIEMRSKINNTEIDFPEKDKIEKKIFNTMDKIVQENIEKGFALKMGKEQVTLRDILKKYLPEGMKLYNSDGKPMALENQK